MTVPAPVFGAAGNTGTTNQKKKQKSFSDEWDEDDDARREHEAARMTPGPTRSFGGM